MDSPRKGLKITGTPRIGYPVNFTVFNTESDGLSYVVMLSTSVSPPFKLGNLTVLLTPNTIFLYSLYYPSAIGLSNSFGVSDKIGRGIATWNIPKIEGLRGLELYVAYAQFNSSQSFPESVKTISNP